MDVVNWQEIRELLAALEQTSVVELTLEVKEFRLTLRKATAESPVVESPNSDPPKTEPPVLAPQVVETKIPVEATSKRKAPPAHWVEVKAPMVGTFYSAPTPSEPNFVQLGERVQRGQTLCIIEAMKLMNELEAETSGRIAEILVENSRPVEFGQVLMLLDPEG